MKEDLKRIIDEQRKQLKKRRSTRINQLLELAVQAARRQQAPIQAA